LETLALQTIYVHFYHSIVTIYYTLILVQQLNKKKPSSKSKNRKVPKVFWTTSFVLHLQLHQNFIFRRK